MSELQSTIEFSVELYKFYNVDLFQRGMYQVRCSLRATSKLSVEIEVTSPEVSTGLGSAIVLGNYGACRPFQILYRNEEISLKDVVLFRCHMLVDGSNLKESLDRAEFSVILELWFSDASPATMVLVSSRTLQLNFSPIEGLHYHLPILFDYFHLSAISLTIHAVLTAIHQPSMKRGILRYMQSCAPKSSKSWSKIRSVQGSTLTDPVLSVNSQKCYNRINDSPQIQLEAYNVLLDSSNNLQTTIKEYNLLLMQREEIIAENYDVLVVKQNEYDSTKLMKKRPHIQNSGLAELCAENIRLWNYFLLTFSCKIAIQQYLNKKHHTIRVRRFAELFFLIYNPRKAAFGNYETNYQNYLLVAEIVRRSKYMQLLPPLPVHCLALDGDSQSMPIIFEDQYQDPFEFEKNNCDGPHLGQSLDLWSFKKAKLTTKDINCSCGIENLWDKRKSSEKTLVNAELYNIEDPLTYTIPTRHSKSLDQLQTSSKNALHFSFNNLLTQNSYNDGVYPNEAYNGELKNVVSEYNMKSNRKYFSNSEFKSTRKYNNSKENICDCSLDNYNSLIVNNRLQKTIEKTLIIVDQCIDLNNINLNDSSQINNGIINNYKQFNIKKITKNNKYPGLVKSFSHTSPDGMQNIFRSNSMQLFTPKNLTSSTNHKFNSLVSTKKNSYMESLVSMKKNHYTEPIGLTEITYQNGHTSKNKINKTKRSKSKESKLQQIPKPNSIHFNVGSTSSSTESISFTKLETGLKNNTESINSIKGLRKVRSTSCICDGTEKLEVTRSESLPNISNIITKLDEKLILAETKYFSSSTSSTSEQSGWITSRSSSEVSSTDATNPARSAAVSYLDNLQKNIFIYSSGYRKNNRKIDDDIFKKKSKFYLDSDSSNNEQSKKLSKYRKQGLEIPLFKGCDLSQSNTIEDFALLPPKQFRDFESPSGSFTNGSYEEELNNSIDNPLYHVVDTETTFEEKPCQLNLKQTKENEDFNLYRESNIEVFKSFLKAKKDFKSQLNFPGLLYSDLNTFASSVPYFHISDEFRIFSPEGMHLIVCVHGLDGNSADLRLVKTYLELGLPGAYLDFLMSERNQGDTFSDFDTMTDRLVSEILHYLDTSSIRPTRVSFVGHSLGNIIIRSALTRPQMKFLLPRLHTFLSLSGPHLGTLYNSSGLVNMGMWFMQKWKKSGSLLQLCLKDAADFRKTFLYRLSQHSSLHNFKNILLCGSGQDRYVPLHSARIELCKESLKDTSELGSIYREMVHNIMSPILSQKDLKLLRYDIHHALPNTANALIGRAAHIAVLDSELFIEKFMTVVGIKYFR